MRIGAVLRAERAAGRLPAGAAAIVAAWIDHLRGAGAPVSDVVADTVVPLAAGAVSGAGGAAERIVGFLVPQLAHDHELIEAVAQQCTTINT
ncbi:MAG TPA: hypothetical protein VMM60_01350 [Ilumatobacter sp.]|nr:hypothetical protein [Ilumatobacter sp.]